MPNNDQLINRILREAGAPDLLDVLAERLTPTDLQSLLLEVYRRRAARLTPAALLAQYEQNRFVRPATVEPQTLLAFDRLALAHAVPPFTAVELSPVAPLGTNAVVALVDQNNAVATSRNTEVVSDSTNVLALECALRRRACLRDPGRQRESVRLCASHRLLRAQHYGGPVSFAHFRLFALCSAGRDAGGFGFELAALQEQLTVYLRLLLAAQDAGLHLGRLRVAITDLTAGRQAAALAAAVVAPLAAAFPATEIGFDLNRQAGRAYYTGVCFHLFATDPQGQEHQIGDGGFTTWTQALLNNAKERLLISGLGVERLCSIGLPDPRFSARG